jgi:peptidoglycan-N-acetylglucosamine deacetylase
LAVRGFLQHVRQTSWLPIILFDLAALTALALAAALNFSASSPPSATSIQPGDKRIAITFDDTPRGPGAFLNAEARPQLLLSQLRQAGVRQAAFFVNPGRVDASNAHGATIQSYAAAGHVLANHTATHISLSGTTAAKFLADISAADTWLKPQKGYRPWFRFPELDEGGKDITKRDAVRAGLKARGLTGGYVTADGWDWFLESQARDAAKAGRKMDMAALRHLYIDTHVKAADFADKLGRRTFGRAPKQILLLHDTDLAALYIVDLVNALRADGWTIISADEAYAKPLPQMTKLPDANGTRLQMLAREKAVSGPYWFERNESSVMKRLFTGQVLHQSSGGDRPLARN